MEGLKYYKVMNYMFLYVNYDHFKAWLFFTSEIQMELLGTAVTYI